MRSSSIFPAGGIQVLIPVFLILRLTSSMAIVEDDALRLLTFLERIQDAALLACGEEGFDAKNYVDLSLKFDLSWIEEFYDDMLKKCYQKLSCNRLKHFLKDHFEEAGTDMVDYCPPDFVPVPLGFLPKVKNPEVREWALKIHALWKSLSRNVADRVLKLPQLHTLIALPEPVIVPGSRFRESYYWDSYWIIRGLIASKMYKTAKAIVTNLIYLVDTYGYVINGARTYYTNRSQPPFFSSMVCAIYACTDDVNLVRKALPALLKEYKFWNDGVHKVTIVDDKSQKHTLSRYYAEWEKPRPESSNIDKLFASKLSTDSEKKKFYREVASAAESGWDFSSRWMRNSTEFTDLTVTSVLPVDLNVYLLKMELDIAYLAKIMKDNKTAEVFLKASQARKAAIDSIFWNADMAQWLDYWVTRANAHKETQCWRAENQNQNVFASNFVPLWIDLFNQDAALLKVVLKSLASSGLVRTAGIATSLKNSGHQWDFPNGWAPLQHMIVEGLMRSGSSDATSWARQIALRWIKSNYLGYVKTGVMHEKYNVEIFGEFGSGGEYQPQTGFGWSNGVVLAFLEELGWPEDCPLAC